MVLDGAPGCLLTLAGRGGDTGLALVLLASAALLRRRRLGVWIVMALVTDLSAAPARADSAGDLSLEAKNLVEVWCTDAVLADPQKAYEAQDRIWPTQKLISDLISGGGPAYLRYWRAKLGTCIKRDELAEADYEAVIAELGNNPTFVGIVKDAVTSLNRLRVKAGKKPIAAPTVAAHAPPVRTKPATAPTGLPRALARLTLAGGGGWQLLGAAHYALFAADLQVRISQGPVHLGLFVEPAFGRALTDPEGAVYLVDGKPKRSVLTTFGPGVVLRFAAGALQPEFGAFLGLAANPTRATGDGIAYTDAGPAFLVGPVVRGGLGIPLGASPLAIRVLAEGGGLVPFPTVRALVMLAGGR